MGRLVGTIAIHSGTRVADNQIQAATVYLNTLQGKIHFSLPNKKQGLAIKKELKALGRSVRFVQANNTATILHNNLV